MKNNNPSRRQFLRVASLSALGFSLPGSLRAHAASTLAANSRLVYIGTYTSGRSEGIYACRLDLATGELRRTGVTGSVVNPSFLTIDRQGQYLYAVNEVNDFEKKASGAISSFSIDQKSGVLKFISQQPSAGADPCHLTLDSANRFVLVANYTGGSVSVLPIHDGSLLAPVDLVQHHGSSANPERQQGPHAHSVVLDKANRRLFVSDLGLDKIMIYDFDSQRGKLTASREPWAKVKAGAGPRHFTFHPSGRWAYVINELDSSVTTFTYDGSRGVLREVQTLSTLPADFAGKNSCAEIEVAPSGRFVYGSNRGHDSIVVFSIEQQTGKLKLVQHISTQGKTPRNFAIDPSGTFLLAANQNSDNVVTFRVNPESGMLSPTGHVAEIPTPVCVSMSDKL